MWLAKKIVMEGFAAEVKQGNYKKIDYLTWRELKELPDAWDLNIRMYGNYSASETNPIFSTISWNGCNCPYEFPANDDSLGKYIKKLVEIYNTTALDLNFSAFSNAINKTSKAAIKAEEAVRTTIQSSNLTVSNSNSWAATSISSNFYEKQPTVEINEKGLKINGQSLNEVIDEALCNSINRKENNSMNLFKNFDFGSCSNDNVNRHLGIL